eukprot:2468290-Prymnesium_polylepis.1
MPTSRGGGLSPSPHPPPHGDGTVVHAVIRHAQPTPAPQCERDRSPRDCSARRCAEAMDGD